MKHFKIISNFFDIICSSFDKIHNVILNLQVHALKEQYSKYMLEKRYVKMKKKNYEKLSFSKTRKS